MSSKPWMPLYIGDFIADTMHLGATETGIYIRLIMHCWQHGTIPTDDRLLARIGHCDARLWRQYRETVLQFFDAVDGVSMHHKRVTSERRRSEEISNKRKAAAQQKLSKSSAKAEQLHPQSQLQSQIQKKDSDADASAQPRDVRKDLFDRGLKTLARITGKTPDSCRSLVGRWLKSVNDEAIHVLGAIDEAERNQVADPRAWIERVLHPKTRAGQQQNVIAAADELVDTMRQWERHDEPDLLENVRGGTRPADVRMLPAK